MTIAEFARWTGYLNGALDFVLLVQLLRYGLARRYGWFFAYFLAEALQGLLLFRLPTTSALYGHVYFGGQAVKISLGLAIAMNLWNRALFAYPALARFGRQVLIYMLLAAMSVAVVGLLLEPSTRPGQNPRMHLFLTIEGAIDSMVLTFLVAAILFLLWFPVKVRRNVAVCLVGFVVYWCVRWAGLLLVNLDPRNARSVNAVMLVLSLGCLVLWALGMRREGEVVTTVTGHRWNPAEVERLLGKLDAINARLERMAR